MCRDNARLPGKCFHATKKREESFATNEFQGKLAMYVSVPQLKEKFIIFVP